MGFGKKYSGKETLSDDICEFFEVSSMCSCTDWLKVFEQAYKARVSIYKDTIYQIMLETSIMKADTYGQNELVYIPSGP